MASPSVPASTILDSLAWRYATKAFDPSKKVSDADFEALKASLVLTPSSFGLQPWGFVVVEDAAKREALLPHSWGQRQVVDASHLIVIAARTDIDETFVDTFLKRIIEVRGVDPSTLDEYRGMILGFMGAMDAPAIANWAKLQTYIALGQLMTTAALMGIDACPMEGFVPAEYDRILGLAEHNLTTAVLCPVGYRSDADWLAPMAKVRNTPESLFTTI